MINTEQFEHTIVIQVKQKRLMGHFAADFRALVADVIEQGNHNIILDLSDVKYLDSCGQGAIISIRKVLSPKGSLLLCGLSGQVEEVFRVTRLDVVFDIFDDATQALAA